MDTDTKLVTPLWRRLRAGLLAVSAAAVMGGAAMAPALADDDGWRHERFEREHWREHERWEHRHYAYVAPGYYRHDYYGYVAPGYAYAPAPVYAAPAFNLVVPLHIR